jgi:hypothetical protein
VSVSVSCIIGDALAIVILPLSIVPVTVKLSCIVVSDVVCPIVIGTPEVTVPIEYRLKYLSYLYLMM